MVMIKSAGRIFGAKLTAAEQKALDIEIRRQLAEYTKRHNREVAAMVLWRLLEQYGFSEQELWAFYRDFDAGLQRLVQYYELDEDDDKWLAGEMLRRNGIDLKEWEERLAHEKP